MSRLSIIKRSHSFIATTQYRNVAHTLQKFAERYEEWEWKKPGKGQKAQRTLIKSYHVTNDSRSTFSFHINAFDDFIKYLEWVGVEKSLYDITTAPMYEPEKIDIKIVSPYSPTEEQVPLIKYLQEPGKTKILTLQTGAGKLQRKSEPVITPNGWMPIGDLKLNDLIITPCGEHVEVIEIHDQGMKKQYKVTFADGRYTHVGLEHLWQIQYEDNDWKITDTEQLIAWMEESDTVIHVPLVDRFDGFDSDIEIKTNAYSDGCEISDDPQGQIPEAYLNTTVERKLKLLKGLFDSAGETDTDNNVVLFETESRILAEQIQYLSRSIGDICYLDETDKGFKLTITAKCASDYFSKSSWIPANPDLTLAITSIEEMEEEDSVCISIDHPDKLYIAKDFIVTHNTYSFLQGFAGIAHRCAMILPAKYIERWVGDLTGDGQVVDLKEEDLVVVKGAAEFARQIAIAKDGEFKAKMMIFSSTTFQIYLKAFAEDPVAAMKEYGCQPSKVMELFKIGVLGRDEVHELFHFNFLVDLNVHVPKTISLSATVDFDNPMTNKMCALMFPKSEQVFNGEWKKYIAAIGLYWKLHKPNLVKTTLNGGYNHGAFETSIIKNKTLLKAYLDMIEDMVDSIYSRFDTDDRMIVFAYTVNMCTLIADRLKERYKDLEGGGVQRYVGEDDYEILNTGTIIVSTLKSAGTAVDLKKLRSVLMTTAIYSTQSNVQALGRLRQMKHKPGIAPEFYYLICKDIDKHVEYHKSKLKQFAGKVLTHETKNTHYAI